MKTVNMRALSISILMLFVTVSSWAVAAEQSVFVYDTFAQERDCPAIQAYLQSLPLRPTVLLSIEQGADFLLDTPKNAARVSCAVRMLRKHGHQVKAMLLQDHGFLVDQKEAVRRMRSLQQYVAKGGGFSGALIDVEPHADPDWECGGLEKQRKLADEYVQLLRSLQEAARPLRFEALVPAWFPALTEVPQLQPVNLRAYIDGFYVMVYGDEGGPLVGGSLDRVMQRFPLGNAYLTSARSYLALATYCSMPARAILLRW